MFEIARAAPEANTDGFNKLNAKVNLLSTNLQSTIEVDDNPLSERAEVENAMLWGPICMCAKRALRKEESVIAPGESPKPVFVYHIVMMIRLSLVGEGL